MLCLESIMARWRERGERRATAERQRARSRSLCSSAAEATLLQLLHRRASSAISSASELITRRGVFSRRQYGSVEQVSKFSCESSGPDVLVRRYRLENGNSLGEKDELFGPHNTPVVENPEFETRWYFKYFLGKVHQNYIGLDNTREPFLLSIVQESTAGLLRAILFNKLGAHKIYIPPSVWANDQRSQTPIRPSVKQILNFFPSMERVDKVPKEVGSAEVQKDVLLLEEQEGSVNFKMGVMFMKPGQKTDDEMLSNEFGDEKWERFITLLGDTIRLKTWTRFRGGLDVKGDMTGLYSVYTMHRGHEIMFHVSTMLPYSKDNKQQLERKRHIGNDIVNIIFTEPEAHETFNPQWIKSHFTHVFAIVSEVPNGYMLSVYTDDSVPPFGPSLPCPPVFYDSQLFRDFLLVKLMNGEKAAFQTPTFALKRQRTLETLIRDIYTEHCTDKVPMLSRRALSDVWSSTSGAAGAARCERFLHFGQAIKLDAVLRGDAPTSLVSSVEEQQRRVPWEGQVWRSTPLPGAPLCAEQIADTKLLLSTNTNTYILEECGTTRVILRWEGRVRDARVTERAGLFRVSPRAHPNGTLSGNAGNAGIYAVPVAELYAGAWAMRPLQDCKQARLSRTKTAHFFDLVENGGKITLAVAVGRRVLLMAEEEKLDNGRGFDYVHIKDIVLCEMPNMIKYLDCGMSIIVAGYKHHWEIINCANNQIVKRADSAEERRGTLVNALRIGDERDRQLVLCYNHTCHFERLTSRGLESDEEYDFHWTTVPTTVLNVFPYIMAFAEDLMEIRLVANGSLIHAACIPGLKLLCGRRDIFYVGCSPDYVPEEEGEAAAAVAAAAAAAIAAAGGVAARAAAGPSGRGAVAGPSGMGAVAGPSGMGAVAGPSGMGAVAGPSGMGAVAGPSGIGPVAGPSGMGAVAGPSGMGAVAGPSGMGAVAGPSGMGAVAGPSGMEAVAGHSGMGAVAGHSGMGAVAGPSGMGVVAGPSGMGAVAGPSGMGSVAGPSGMGAAAGPSGSSGAAGPSSAWGAPPSEGHEARRRRRRSSMDDDDDHVEGPSNPIRVASGSNSRLEGSASSCSSSVSSEHDHIRPPLQRMAPVSPPSSPQTKGTSESGAANARCVRVFKIPQANLCGAGRQAAAAAAAAAPAAGAAAADIPPANNSPERPSSIRQRLAEMNLEHRARARANRERQEPI